MKKAEKHGCETVTGLGERKEKEKRGKRGRREGGKVVGRGAWRSAGGKKSANCQTKKSFSGGLPGQGQNPKRGGLHEMPAWRQNWGSADCKKEGNCRARARKSEKAASHRVEKVAWSTNTPRQDTKLGRLDVNAPSHHAACALSVLCLARGHAARSGGRAHIPENYVGLNPTS